MRINKFNPNYIMIDFSDIARITLSQAKNYEKEFISEFINIEKIIYKDYKDKIEIFINQNKEIAIRKDSSLGQAILNKSLIKTKKKRITEDMMKNALVIAVTEEKYEYAKKISDIIITIRLYKYDYDIEDYEIFKMIYGEELANFIMNNGNIKEYINIIRGEFPNEDDRYVYFYENNNMNKICLPIPEEEIKKKK
ncbi:MAG: hypothetical protein IJZ46_03655 [Bacilli bacterium]|nr:hypothetical protein [Bacilli bacterium]